LEVPPLTRSSDLEAVYCVGVARHPFPDSVAAIVRNAAVPDANRRRERSRHADLVEVERVRHAASVLYEAK
jgi:hypothetical protein